MMDETKVAIVSLQEKVIALDQKASAAISAAHTRIDRLEIVIMDDLRDLRGSFRDMSGELKEIMAYVNRSKGWGAAAMFAAGLLGGLLIKFLMSR